jgi:hypothetical protein
MVIGAAIAFIELENQALLRSGDFNFGHPKKLITTAPKKHSNPPKAEMAKPSMAASSREDLP